MQWMGRRMTCELPHKSIEIFNVLEGFALFLFCAFGDFRTTAPVDIFLPVLTVRQKNERRIAKKEQGCGCGVCTTISPAVLFVNTDKSWKPQASSMNIVQS